MRVYGASKLSRAMEWIQLRQDWPEVEWTARWPDLVGSVPDNPGFAKLFWQHDLEDVAKANGVMVLPSYEGESQLRGALVEAGAALALGKFVLLVDDCPEYGTWQHHPLCYKVADLLEAREMLRLLTPTHKMFTLDDFVKQQTRLA